MDPMRTLVPAVLAALLAVAAPAPAAAQDPFAELVKEFPPRVAERGDPDGRSRLVERLSTFDNADGARVLMAGLAGFVDRLDKDMAAYEAMRKRYEEVNVPVDVARDNYKTRTELQNRLMEEEAKQRDDSKVLDAFRDGFKKYRDARALTTITADVRKIKSWRALVPAAEGLGANPAGAEAAIRLGKEFGDLVAAAALRGLRGRNEDVVFACGKEGLKSTAWPVRLEAALTLEKMNQPRVLPPLIEALAKEEGRLREDIRDVLRRLTSQNFDAEPEQWRMWWVENKSQLEGETGGAALFGSFKGKVSAPEKKSVYGIESRSRRIVFVIDTSGSMKEPIHSAKGTPTGLSAEEIEELNMTKIDLAKKELKRAIRALETDAWFNIVSFGTNVIRWKEKMVRGDMTTKNEAYAFVSDMEAAGGTWAYGALQEAFLLAGGKALDKYYDPAADTIYFISDGAPTDNDMDKPALQDPEVVLSAVREWNKVGKVAVHAIAIDPRAGGGKFIDFMKKLASQNSGQYTQRD
jgi:uncharacterized protein YegL